MIVLMRHGNNSRLRIRKRVEHMVSHSDQKHPHQRLLPVIYNFLNLSDRESVIVIAVIPVHALGKWGQIKTLPIHTRLTCSFGPGHSLNRLSVQVGGKDFSVGIARVAVCKNKEAKNG